jgi:hypothetical protein
MPPHSELRPFDKSLLALLAELETVPYFLLPFASN